MDGRGLGTDCGCGFVLLATIVFLKLMLAPLPALIPPPVEAVLPAIVELVIVVVPSV